MENWQEKVENLKQQKLSIIIEKNGEIIFQSVEPMLKPLFRCLTENSQEMEGAVVIDKIVGRAAAFLCILGKVAAVYTPLAGQTAVSLLEKSGITVKAVKIIPQIMNRDNTGPCPMEKMASGYESPLDFYKKLEEMYSKK
jgi:hypothetical protein